MDANLSGSAIGQLALVYATGLGTVFTPCIYPLIPVTISLFGVTANLSRWKAFLLAATYVAGICLTYTALGIFSGKTGALFGSFLGNPIIVGVLSIFFFLLALFSVEIIQLSFIGKLQNRASQIGGKGYGGAFLMGLVSGFVAAPCAGPILIGVLAIAANSQSTSWGALLLFTYALGFGTVFLILGTFSNLTNKLPRAGNWMTVVKFISAAALMGVIWFISKPFLTGLFSFMSSHHSVALLIALIAASIFGAIVSYKKENNFGKVSALIVSSFAAFQLFVVGPTAAHQGWLTSLEDAKRFAKEQHKVALVDLYAEWCGACKELDAKTFSDSQVQEKLTEFVTARVDFSIIGDEQGAIQSDYDVAGLPCILFFGPDGKEIPESKITEFQPPVEFMKNLDRVASKL